MRPLMPPALLIRSTAIWVPTRAVLPPAAAAPLSGWSVPILRVLACPNAPRHGAGTSMPAPSAPAVAAPRPSNRRRVSLPLYQKLSSFAHGSSFQSSAMSVTPWVAPSPLSSPPLGERGVRRLGLLPRDGFERFLEDLYRSPNFLLPMRQRHVELRRGLDHSAPEHRLGEGGVQPAVGRERGAVVGDGPVGEIDLEHRRLAGHLGREARLSGGLGQSCLEPRPRREQPLVLARLPQLGERREPRGGRDRIAVESAGLEDHLTRALQLLGEVAHDVASAYHGGQRKTAADDLAERRQIGHDTVILLGAAPGEAEAGDDLVEDQRDAVSRGHLPYAAEKCRVRDDEALEGLHDHRGQILVMRLDDGLRLGQIVERRDQHLFLDGLVDARRVRRGRRPGLGGAGANAHEGIVVSAVEAALEFQDLVSLAEGARQPQREERRLTPRRAEAHLLGTGHRLAEQLRERQRGLGELEIGRALAELSLDRGQDGRMSMSQHQRTRAQDVIDILAARIVVESRALALPDDAGELLRGIVAAERAAGEQAQGLLEQRVFFGAAAGWGCHRPRWRSERLVAFIPQAGGAPQLLRRWINRGTTSGLEPESPAGSGLAVKCQEVVHPSCP